MEAEDYVLEEKNLEIKPGETAIDAARRTPGKSLVRSFEGTSDHEQIHAMRIPGFILCKGAAVGIDKKNQVSHFFPGRDLAFLGFLVGQGDNLKVAVQSRGSVFLLLPNAKQGDLVYCSGPDSFSLSETPGSALIGRVRYVQGNRAAVAFRRASDPRPLKLDF